MIELWPDHQEDIMERFSITSSFTSEACTGKLRVKEVFAVVVLIKCLCCAVESTKGLCSKTSFVGRSTEQYALDLDVKYCLILETVPHGADVMNN